MDIPEGKMEIVATGRTNGYRTTRANNVHDPAGKRIRKVSISKLSSLVAKK
jgi:hypothetical protein